MASDLKEPARKKPKRSSRWQKEWKCFNMVHSEKGSSYAHCKTCAVDFSVAGGGLHEVKRHIQAKKHQDE